jgi:spore maturation protein CgeB
MASKCLIVGHAPKEMVELFGYQPVIEIDWKDPTGQIEYLLQNFDLHIPLIERNYREVMTKHTWADRFSQIKHILCSKNSNKAACAN